uniref:Uncharacterized protein n=1 Tax=Rhizophora mucronata TaxID=61149 RepID=A0A2P2QGF3_RHIMU
MECGQKGHIQSIIGAFKQIEAYTFIEPHD